MPPLRFSWCSRRPRITSSTSAKGVSSGQCKKVVQFDVAHSPIGTPLSTYLPLPRSFCRFVMEFYPKTVRSLDCPPHPRPVRPRTATSRALPPARRVSTPVLPLLPPLSVLSMACQFRTLDASRLHDAGATDLLSARVGSPTGQNTKGTVTHMHLLLFQRPLGAQLSSS
jgi:hypothetical protein